MVKRRYPDLDTATRLRHREHLVALGREVRASRRRRRWTQGQLAASAGLSRSTISAIECGHGGSHTLDTWLRIGAALDRPAILVLARDAMEEPIDAGHLGVQELVLQLARRTRRAGSFELPTRPAEPRHSVDACLRDDTHRLLLLVECWNTIGDIGASARSTARKVAEADALAIAIGHGRPYRAAACWVVRATRRNRDLVARYPAVFAARFRGSSAAWVNALANGAAPPDEPGLVWCDLAATRLFAWRRPVPNR